MSPEKKLICLITPGHLTSTPRLLKEADALVAVGYRVHVIHGSNYAPNVPLDAEIARQASWQSTAVPYSRGVGAIMRKIRRRLAQKLLLSAPFASAENAAWAHSTECFRLAEVAAEVDAHYYIGHCLGGLVAAAMAAERTHAAFGFDIEDFHDAETPEIAADPLLRAIARILQASYLPRAKHLTAASPLIAAQYPTHYGLEPIVTLNAFPVREAPPAPIDPGPVSPTRPARLYWFSQTVGPRRGLEEMIAVLAQVQTPAELHLRGHASEEYLQSLRALASQLSCRWPIVHLPFAASASLPTLAADFDLGLSIEQCEPLNRSICLANKIFIYLLGGVPQLMSDTQAHLALEPELGPAAMVGNFSDPMALARRIDDYFADPTRIALARNTAWQLGQEKYNWEHEQKAFLAAVRKAAGKP